MQIVFEAYILDALLEGVLDPAGSELAGKKELCHFDSHAAQLQKVKRVL